MSIDSREILYFVLSWIINHAIEVLATLTGILYLIYSVRASVWLWPLGFVTSALYVYVFYTKKIYADMGINVYYVVVSIYGWVHWHRVNKSGQQEELPILNLTRIQWFISLIITCILFIIIAWILVKYTDSDVSLIDSFTTSASIVATWMLARKIIEHWLFWIVIDAVSMGLYIYKGLYPTVVLFTVYTCFAILGYVQWRKIQKTNMNDNEEYIYSNRS